MKTFNVSIALVFFSSMVVGQETKDTIKTDSGENLIINETLKRKLDNKEVEIQVSNDPSKSSIVIKDTDTTRLKLGNTEILILEDKQAKERKKRYNFDLEDKKAADDDNFDAKKNRKKKSDFEGHYSSLNYGINLLSYGNLNFSLPDTAKFMELNENKSYEFALNLFQFEIPFSKRVGLVSGLGMTWNHYRFDNSSYLLDNSQPVITYTIDTINKWTKNQLNVWSIQVPLLVEGQVKIGDDVFWCGIGGYGGFKLSSKIKLKNEEKHKTIFRQDYHLNPIMYGLSVRAGYGDFGIFANYALNPLFKKSEGPELNNFTVGLTLTFN